MDKYTEKIIKKIKKSIDDSNALIKIIDKIYEDGFYDGDQECRDFDPDNI